MEYLLKTEGVKIINNHRAGNLPDWNIPAVIQIEDTKESVFDIADFCRRYGYVVRIEDGWFWIEKEEG